MIVGGVTVVVLAGLLTWALWPSNPAPRARQYLAFNACLLTDEHGITGAQAAPVWAGMQDASLRTHAKVEYLPVYGAASEANALPYLAGLIQRRCDVIVGVGAAEVAAVDAYAPSHPKIHFVVVEATSTARPDVEVVADSGSAAVRQRVAGIVTQAVARSGQQQ
jgi:basic membrane lipoprotein Med (substrate-binding protein (PBP1-ABC) superfamily)